jgi:hypothetical protein
MNSAGVRRPLAVTTITAFSAFSVIMQGGCQQEPERPALATYPVKGKVVATGKLPVGGCVQFQPVENGANYVANGIIDEQGSFSLQVPYVDRVLPGATKGPHTVRVLLPLSDGGTPVPIAGAFVVQPRDNEFTIEMPKTPAG